MAFLLSLSIKPKWLISNIRKVLSKLKIKITFLSTFLIQSTTQFMVTQTTTKAFSLQLVFLIDYKFFKTPPASTIYLSLNLVTQCRSTRIKMNSNLSLVNLLTNLVLCTGLRLDQKLFTTQQFLLKIHKLVYLLFLP